MTINFEDLTKALELLVVGWGGVFLVLGLIALSSIALTKAFPPHKGGADD